MTAFVKKLEVAANISIIVLVVVVGTVFIRNTFFPSSGRSREVPVGSKFELADAQWGQSDKTLVLVLRKDCPYCTASAPFYQRLVQETGKQGVRVVAVFPHTTDESKAYLEEVRVSISDIRQASLESMGVGGTPTLVLVNKQGKVVQAWAGQLPAEREAEVVRKLRS